MGLPEVGASHQSAILHSNSLQIVNSKLKSVKSFTSNFLKEVKKKLLRSDRLSQSEYNLAKLADVSMARDRLMEAEIMEEDQESLINRPQNASLCEWLAQKVAIDNEFSSQMQVTELYVLSIVQFFNESVCDLMKQHRTLFID